MKQCCKIVFSLFFVLFFISPSYSQQDSLLLPPNSRHIIAALNFKDTDIRDVLNSIAFEYHTNIVVDNKINSKISTSLFNVDVFHALKIIAEDNGHEFSFDKQRFFIKAVPEKIQPAPPETEPEINFADGKIDIDLNNADLAKVVVKLREKTKKNFLLTNGTTGRITGTLKDIELETGLRNLLQNNGYYLNSRDSIYYISRSSYFSSLETANEKNKGLAYWVNAHAGKITIDVNQASLDKVITDIANQLSLQVVKLAIPNSSVTLRCSNVSLNDALDYLFRGTEYSFKNNNGAIVIGNKTSKSLDNYRLVKLHYLRADKVKDNIPQAMLQLVTVSVSTDHNALVLTGTYENVSAVEDYITTIDKPVAQVLIEALVVDYNLDNLFKFGLKAGRGDSTAKFGSNKFYPGVNVTLNGRQVNDMLSHIGNIRLLGKDLNVGKLAQLPSDFYLNISAMEQRGIVNIKSRPLLSTINGHTASLKIGTVQNYLVSEIMPVTSAINSTFLEKERFEKIEANISFEITPWVGPNNELTLDIKPEFQNPVGEFVPDKKQIPAINTRTFQSTVRLKDGETIILGGLIQETETNTVDKFPLLGDIPFIGQLFSNVDKRKGKAELVIYLTPRIFYGDDFGMTYYDYSR